MSWRVRWVVFCDHPGCDQQLEAPLRQYQLRREAQRRGWRFDKSNRVALCPAHERARRAALVNGRPRGLGASLARCTRLRCSVGLCGCGSGGE